MMAITEFLLDLAYDTVSLLHGVLGKALSVVADAGTELLYGDGVNWSGCCERAIVTFGDMLLLRLLQFCSGSKRPLRTREALRCARYLTVTHDWGSESGLRENGMAQREYDSFAIGVFNCGNAAAHVDLSINVWADIGRSSEIDFGVQIPCKDEITGLFIFVPFRIDENDVVDLSPSFRDNEFNQVLFNRDCKTTCCGSQTIVIDDCGNSLLVLPFAWDEGLTVDYLEGGSLLSLSYDVSALSRKTSSLYFRMRMPFTSLGDLLSGPADMREVITGPIVPFRTMISLPVNQVRGLPNSVVRRLVDSKTDVGETHIAVIASRQWEVNSVFTPYRVRLLEAVAWEQYQPRVSCSNAVLFPKGHDMFVYQWLISDCSTSLQLEFSRKRITVLTLLFYLAILFLINLLSEVLIRLVL